MSQQAPQGLTLSRECISTRRRLLEDLLLFTIIDRMRLKFVRVDDGAPTGVEVLLPVHRFIPVS